MHISTKEIEHKKASVNYLSNHKGILQTETTVQDLQLAHKPAYILLILSLTK